MLADPPPRVAGMNDIGLCKPMAREAFAGWLLEGLFASLAFVAGLVAREASARWLLAGLFAILAFVAGLALGWILKGCSERPVTTASAVVTVQASPAPPPVDAPEAGSSRQVDAARADAIPDIIFVSGYGEKFRISQKCLRECGGRQVRSLQPCRRCTLE